MSAPKVKWRKAGAFSVRRASISYAEFDGTRVARVLIEVRNNPTSEWRYEDSFYHLTANGFMTNHIERVPAMVAAWKRGDKKFKDQ